MHSLFFSFVLVSLVAIAAVSGDCYKDWSRCTPATSFWTGILWKSCPDYCRRCKGRASGGCEPVSGKAPCAGGYQCQCKGVNVDKSGNWLVKATCKLGL